MARIAIVLGPDFEDVEFSQPRDALRSRNPDDLPMFCDEFLRAIDGEAS